MYGLINKAIHGLVRERFGPEAWERIRTRAGVPDEPFLSMESYPDAVTYDIVAAATEELGMPAADILRAFGRYWTVYTATAGYGELMATAGRSFPEFLRNLDQLHSRVRLSFPRLEPPSFSVSDERADALTLHYFTGRQGLAPLVEGLLQGLAERFGVEVDIRHEFRPDAEPPHDIFHLSWRPAAGSGPSAPAAAATTGAPAPGTAR